MKKLWVIAGKDIREAVRSRSTYIYIVVLIILTFSYFNTYNALINQITASNPSRAVLVQASQSFLNSIAYTLPMMYGIFICTIFATYSVIVDKAKHNIESLLVTPISLNQLWMGKTLAVTLPSVIIALAVSIIAYIVMNIVLVIPHTGLFIIPSAISLVTAIILTPILIFAIVSLVIYLQLIISNPRIANFVFTGIFLLLFFSVNFLTTIGSSINFAFIYLGVIIVCASVSYILSRSLTKEKVILSSKG